MTHEDELLHKRLKRLKKNSDTEEVVFKNYKVMCEQLKLPITSSNGKKAQIKRLGHFCDIEKDGQKYIFTEVYEDPDFEMLQENVLVSEIEKILLSVFLEQKSKSPEILLDYYGYYILFGFCNSKFSKPREEYEFKKNNNISAAQVDNFHAKSLKRFSDLLKSALEKMEDHRYIKCFNVDIVTYSEKSYKYLEKSKSREALPEEVQRVLNYESVILAKMGLKRKNDVYAHKKQRQFYQERQRMIQENEKDWLYYNSGYRIICNQEKWLRQGLERNLEERRNYQLKVNEYIRGKLLKSGETSYSNYQMKLADEYNSYKQRNWQDDRALEDVKEKLSTFQRMGQEMDNAYLENFNKFVEEFVRIV